ncbi:MAG: hypothetical protein ACJARS_004672 [bacterium]|jgi:hypothetical protein
MPQQTRRPETAATQSTGSETATPQAEVLQDPLQDQLKEGGSSAGLANYQASLGKWLGSELYGALAKELTLASLQDHAAGAWASALKSGVSELDGLDGNDKEAGAFTAALQAAYGEAAGNMLETDVGKKVISKLNGFVDANPRLILLVALLAAGGAVAANVALPKFSETFKLGSGFTAKVGGDLGKIREMALKDLSAALEYNSGPLMAAVSVNRKEDGTVTGDFKSSLGDDAKNIKADAKFNNDGITVYNASGLLTMDSGTKLDGSVTGGADKNTVINGSVTSVNGDVTTTNSVNYDATAGTVSFKNLDIAKLGDNGTLKSGDGSSSDGSSYKSLGIDGNVGENGTGSASVKQTTGADGALTNEANGAYDYKNGDFAAGLKAKYDGGNGFVSGNVSNTFSPGFTGKAALKQTFGDTSIMSGSGALDYKSKNFNTGLSGQFEQGSGGSLTAMANGNFNERTSAGFDLTQKFGENAGTSGNINAAYNTDKLKFGGSAGFDTNKNAFNANAFGQADIGDKWKGRVDGSYKTSDSGTNFEAGGLAYRKINDDLSVFGGGSVKYDDMGGTRFIPKVGVEVKGIPLQYSFDPATKQHKVGITLFKW